MPGVFDSKNFNAEVFQRYVDRVPNTKRNELIRSRAIRTRPDLAAAMADQTGGNYITTPLRGLISGQPAQNYDGATDMEPSSTTTFSHSRVVVGRMKSWVENDFSFDITGGEDFMANIAQQVAEYWEEIDQATLVAILKGVFSMNNNAKDIEFVTKHTYDITGKQNSNGVTGEMDGTTLNTGMQKACGDNKGRFSLAIMHSAVSTNLENLKILVYAKYNDANGMERDVAIGTINGRLVLVDDSMPSRDVESTAGVYEVTLSGTYAADDVVTVAGEEHTVVSGSTSASAIATALATALAENEVYTVTASSGKLTFTEKTGHYGTGAPVAEVESTAGKIAVETTTAAVVYTEYTTYVLGDGAIEYTNCGAKVPYETGRDPKTNGGQDTLYSRQRKCYAPYGISFTKQSMSRMSPSDVELAKGVNWTLVHSEDETPLYIDHKAIPIARVLSRG